jgi:hypothetical protein
VNSTGASQTAICDNFTTWPDLNKILSSSQCNPTDNPLFSLTIRPSEQIALANELNLTALGQAVGNSISNMILTFININGIDIIPWSSMNDAFHLFRFEHSAIEFYVNKILASDFKCSSDLVDGSATTFFNLFIQIAFLQGNSYPSQTICPYIFLNGFTDSVTINGLSNSKLIKNLWRFQSYERNETTKTIYSGILFFHVQGFNFSLDTSLLHPLVFENIASLAVYGSVGSIQTDLFEHFQKLNNIHCFLNNYKYFFHAVDINWTHSLPMNPNPVIIFSTFNQGGDYANKQDYTYPDEDFCLFAGQYPKSIIIILDTNLTECTKTIRWIISNYDENTQRIIYALQQYPNAQQIYSVCNSSTCEALDFGPLLAMCKMSHLASGTTRTTTMKPCEAITTTTTTSTTTTTVTTTVTHTTTTTTTTNTLYYIGGAEARKARVFVIFRGVSSILVIRFIGFF